ncbi:hypothetical protein [Paenibacillus sp. 23TSA30-6]|uniref:hypothetical protein n=1 Tax=Paenibacillus sp. 23TSA30-6 TaxID=2546104 RepID=UPI0017883B0D|nr:hypothetical protein [Paenibacillus sp. 23TSA30-6]MBE0338714.1 hypothetical protein [Paenibacillus sp. 23TSA30-6]
MSTTTMILGYPYPKRKEILKGFHEANFKYRRPLKFRNDVNLFNVYEVSIEMPKYRLANGRTQAAQEEFLAGHRENPKNFFEIDLESDEKHRIQHDILKSLLKDKSIDLIEYFKTAKQEEPIIIDDDGFVINGNRRLCALRELYYSNPEKYVRFKSIDVLLLPPCEEIDKDELEANLQIKQDIKADYSWISQACMFRKRQRDYSYTDKELASLYDKKESEVRELLDMLGYADEYLESRNMDKRYDEVEKKQFGFKQIRKFNEENKQSDISEKDIFKNVTYFMLDENADELGLGRLYSVINDLNKYFDYIEEALIKELPLDNYEIDEQYDEQLNLFESIADESDEKKILKKLAMAVNDQQNREDIVDTVKDVIEKRRILENDDKSAKFVIKQIGKAQSFLLDALNHFDEETELEGITEQLESVSRLIQQLRGKVEQLC